jgi:hypothetical protein
MPRIVDLRLWNVNFKGSDASHDTARFQAPAAPITSQRPAASFEQRSTTRLLKSRRPAISGLVKKPTILFNFKKVDSYTSISGSGNNDADYSFANYE